MKDTAPRIRMMNKSRWVAISSLMTALALVGNYILVFIPNVELGSTILFLIAYVFGLTMGIWCTLLMSIIFTSINPWGAFIPQIWISQVIGWVYIILIGSILGRQDQESESKKITQNELFLIGISLTFFFDMVTNIGYSLAFSLPFSAAILFGLPFMIAHVVSNGIIFSLVIPRVKEILAEELYSVIWETETIPIIAFSEE